MERDVFLRRVRRAVAEAELPDAPAEDPGLLVPDMGEVDLVRRFGEALELVGGRLHTGDAVEVAAQLAGRLGEGTFLAWDDDRLPPGVGGAVEEAGLRRIPARVPVADRIEHQIGYEHVVLGVTSAEAGLAESGSIVVRSGRGRPRMASLIPPVHLAFLRTGDIHRSLSHWAHLHADSLGESANVAVITGVSRTGDIEMRLNTGVHGPAEIHVCLV